MITISKFGYTKDGREVLAIRISDGDSFVTLLNYGGTVQSLVVPAADGTPTDVVLGYNDVASYENTGGYLGALIGRFANRIGEGKLTIDGVHYDLYINDRGNHLHGGKTGFESKIWAHEIVDEYTVAFSILSPDGEENYPGNLSVRVAYTFRHGTLKIHYRATTDKKTAINLTNHAYFNLSGEGDGSILDHLLWIDCDRITPTNPTMIPVGGFKEVAGTPFDFNTPKPIGRDIGADDIDLIQGNGYDHCYILKTGKGKYAKFASATSPKTGITMNCYTDAPAVELYVGNNLDQEGKTIYYNKRAAFCLETHNIPNNVNVPEYAAIGNSILDVGEVYESTTEYEFKA